MSRNGERRNVILPQIIKSSQDQQNENYNFIASKKKIVMFKDKDDVDFGLVEDLKKKIEEQKKDIDQRNQAIFSIQRNFESLSLLLKNEKQENQGNRDELTRQKESNVELLMRIKFLTQKVQEAEVSQEHNKHELESILHERKQAKKQGEELMSLKFKSDELNKMLDKKQEDIVQMMLKVKEFNIKTQQLQSVEAEKLIFLKKQEQLNKQVNEYENQQIAILAENETLKNKLSQKSQQLSEQSSEVDQYKKINHDLKQVQGGYHQQIAKFTQLLDDERLKTKQLQNILESEKTKSSLQDENEISNKQAYQSISQKFAEREKILEQQKKQIESFQVQLSYYSPFKEFIINLTQLQEQCKSEIKLIPKFEHDQIKSNLGALQVTNNLLDKELTTQNSKNMDLIQVILKLESTITLLKQQLTDKEQELDGYMQALSDLENKQINNDQNTTQNQDLLKQSQERNKKQGQHINAIENENSQLKSSLEQVTSDLKQQQALMEIQSSKIQQIQGKNSLNSSELQMRDNEVIDLKDRLQSHILQSETLNKQLSEALLRQDNLEKIAEQAKLLYDQKLANLESSQGADGEKFRQLKMIFDVKEREYELKNQIIKENDLKLANLESLQEADGEKLRQLKIINDLKEREFELKNQIIKENELTLISMKNKQDDKDNEFRKLKLDFDSKMIIFQQGQKELMQKDDLIYQQNLDIKSITSKISQLELQIDALNPAHMKKQLQDIEQRDKDFQNILLKIEHAQDSTVTSISCGQCMELLASTMTCVPCGHSFCQKCPLGYETGCSECQNGDSFFQNKQMDDIVAKIKYCQATLKNLKGK